MDVFYTTGQVARELKVSNQTVRNHCASGVIKASRSAGGHFRIEPAELERLKNLGSLPSVARPALSENGTRPTKKNPNELLAEPSIDVIESAEEAYVSDRQLVRDTHQLHRMKIRKEAVELQDFFDAREQAQLDKRLEEERRQAELDQKQIQQRHAELAAEGRRRFERKWLEYAIERKRWDSPADYVLLIKPELLATLANIEPDESDYIVQRSVDAAIARALQPWNTAEERRQAKAQAIERALDDLPFYMRFDRDWQARARKSACEAVDGARDDTSANTLAALARVSVHPLIQEYEHGERIQSALGSVFLPTGNVNDLDEAREAVQTALSALPVGASDRQIEQTKNNALAPVQQRITTRSMMARLEARLPRELSSAEKTTTLASVTKAITAMPSDAPENEWEKTAEKAIDRQAKKHQLVEEGLREVPRHAQWMVREYEYSARETALDIEQRVKAKVEEELRKQLDGTEDSEDVIAMVWDIMEEFEGCRD
jgi:excisionase family DNA binding protein